VESLPSWVLPLPDAETMRAVDRWAIDEQGVDGLELMERAGAAVAKALEQMAPDGMVCVLCGKGNNGGDGFVVARLLRQAGRDVSVLLTSPPSELSGDARANFERLPGMGPLRLDGFPWNESVEGGNPDTIDRVLLERAEVLVDALLGTGFQGQLRGRIAELVTAMNESGRPVLSVDVPSGLDVSTGVSAGVAVRAKRTVTFHAAKPGHWIRPGKALSGTVEVAPIGIPRGAPMPATIGLIQDSVLGLAPRRDADSTKFASGHVLVVGGSVGLSGAPALAARAAMRAGAGYVTALVPKGIQAILASGTTPELMASGLPERDGSLSEDGLERALQAGERGGALALGPGLGRTDSAAAFARLLARRSTLSMVLDADGLNAHSGQLGELAGRNAATVLTPHAGELGRLLGLESSEIEHDRLRHVRAAAALSGAIVVLKGDDTLVADPSGRVAVSAGGSPALATAGTGDVLTGVIAALLSQQLDPFTAAACAVQLHARAGRLAARRIGAAEGVIASDVIEALPEARSNDVSDSGGEG
jgi:ADP-dependent NAD(P)H-hydrate dehydratase / NAD(P)H-hydrate epimerase